MNFKRRNKRSAEFNMSSMTDIVFLLLIFFIIALTTMSSSNALDLVLPSADGKSNEVETVAVSINNDLGYFIDKNEISKNEIEYNLIEKLSKSVQKNIILNIAAGVPIENAVYIMDIAYRNNFNVVLAVAPK